MLVSGRENYGAAHTVVYCSITEKNTIVSSAGKWKKLEITISANASLATSHELTVHAFYVCAAC